MYERCSLVVFNNNNNMTRNVFDATTLYPYSIGKLLIKSEGKKKHVNEFYSSSQKMSVYEHYDRASCSNGDF